MVGKGKKIDRRGRDTEGDATPAPSKNFLIVHERLVSGVGLTELKSNVEAILGC